jgi:glycosyltransferase involved in cell wall biosynthesis
MYLPKNLEITGPYVSRWYGESGRQYEFGVVRSAFLRVDEPFVYVLAKHEGNMIVPLSVGQTGGGLSGPNGNTPREWEQALAEGMTHAHLRFEARSEAFRQAEVQDLALALRPILGASHESDNAIARLSPDRPVEEAVPPEAKPEAGPEAIGIRLAPQQGERAPRRPWFVAAREWGARARAATPSLAGLLGRVRQSLAVTKGSDAEPYQGNRTQHAAAEPSVPKPPVSQPRDPEPPVPEPRDPEPPVSEPPVSEPPDQEPPVSELPDREPPVSEPPPSEVPSGARADSPARGTTGAKAVLGLDPAVPVALFADELSAAAGADILVDAAITVGHDDRALNFLFVGEGPLRGELEARVGQAGLLDRARFLGDASAESFEQVFAAADFVIIPARAQRNGALARRAAAAGKPVLVTHEASVDAVVHGRNGLVTYDNPGSLVWGLRELVHCSWVTRNADDCLRQSVAA